LPGLYEVEAGASIVFRNVLESFTTKRVERAGARRGVAGLPEDNVVRQTFEPERASGKFPLP